MGQSSVTFLCFLALCELPGVGAKVADCVCLMSLDKTEAVPVDTHVWQLTTKHYMPHLQKTKSLTTKMYKEIGEVNFWLLGKFQVLHYLQCKAFTAWFWIITFYLFTFFVTMVINSGEGIKPIFKPHLNRCKFIVKCYMLMVLLCKVWNQSKFEPTTPNVSFVPWSPKCSATMLDPFL